MTHKRADECKALADAREALKILRNEVRGTLYAHELAIRYDHGNWNWNCLEIALAKAEAVLAVTP